MIKVLPIFTFLAMVAFGNSAALGFTLVNSELKLRTQAQLNPTTQLFVTSFPASAVVSESTVEFPNVDSLFDPSTGVPPGFANSLVNVSIDAGVDYLAIDFDNAGFGRFATAFQNTYVFSFTVPTALQITDVLIDPSTNLGLTPNRVTFEGNELFVNVQGLFFNPNSFARVNLNGTITPKPVPTPSFVLGLSIAALGGAMLKRHTKRKALVS